MLVQIEVMFHYIAQSLPAFESALRKHHNYKYFACYGTGTKDKSFVFLSESGRHGLCSLVPLKGRSLQIDKELF